MADELSGFGARVRKTREARNLTASGLARMTEVSPTAVWNWENKDRIPQTKTLAALSKALKVSKEWLLKGDELPSAIEGTSPMLTSPARQEPKIEAMSDSSSDFRQRLIDAFEYSNPNDVSLSITGGKTLRVFGQVYVGSDYIEFQPESSSNKLVVIPLAKISEMMI